MIVGTDLGGVIDRRQGCQHRRMLISIVAVADLGGMRQDLLAGIRQGVQVALGQGFAHQRGEQQLALV